MSESNQTNNPAALVRIAAEVSGAKSWDEFKAKMHEMASSQESRSFSPEARQVIRKHFNLVLDCMYEAARASSGPTGSLAQYVHEKAMPHMSLMDVERGLIAHEVSNPLWEQLMGFMVGHVAARAANIVNDGQIQGRDVCRVMQWPLIEYGVDTAKIDEFTQGYLEAALWSSHDVDDQGNVKGNLDDNYGIDDIATESLVTMIDECKQFQEENADLLKEAGSPGRNGHDFWLTRNSHGAGYWDRGYDKKVGDGLTQAAKDFGGCDLEVWNDGKVHRLDETSSRATLEFDADTALELDDEEGVDQGVSR